MKRVNQTLPKDTKLSWEEIHRSIFKNLSKVSLEHRIIIEKFVLHFLIPDLVLLSQGYCPHGHEDWDDCPDCCH